MKTFATITEFVVIEIISRGTGYNNKDEIYNIFKVESTITKDGFEINTGLKSSKDSSCTCYCHRLRFDSNYEEMEQDGAYLRGRYDNLIQSLDDYFYPPGGYEKIVNAIDGVISHSKNVHKNLVMYM